MWYIKEVVNMQRFFITLLTLALTLTLASCAAMLAEPEPPAPLEQPPEAPPEETPPEEASPEPEPFPGKIVIFADDVDRTYVEVHRSAQELAAKYGADKIIFHRWPDVEFDDPVTYAQIFSHEALFSENKAQIFIPPWSNSVASYAVGYSIREIIEARHNLMTHDASADDMFIALVAPDGDLAADTLNEASLVLIRDDLAMGSAMVEQAYKMGAKTFVHYSFPRHMDIPVLFERRELIRQECEKLGLAFVYAETADPWSDIGIANAQQALLEDVPKQIAKYGPDTAFFCTQSYLQVPLIEAVVEGGAIYPHSLSPYEGFPEALGLAIADDEMLPLDYVISETARALKEKGMLGRVSAWPVSADMLFTSASAEYAIKWINGEVPKEGIDYDVLRQCLEDYAGVKCYIRPYEEDGKEYPNFLLVREEYMTYGTADDPYGNYVEEHRSAQELAAKYGEDKIILKVPLIKAVVEGGRPEAVIEDAKASANKTRQDGTRRVGDTLEYTIIVKNAGPAKSLRKNVIAIDVLPTEVDYVAGSVKIDGVVAISPESVYNPATRTIAINLSNIAGSVTKTVTFEAIINDTAYGKVFKNAATIDGKPVIEIIDPPPVLDRSP
jgi:uncharacterized repeat protein (TIGR01451 family)